LPNSIAETRPQARARGHKKSPHLGGL